jgi:hypothetical protein
MFKEFIMSENLTENLLVQENKYIIIIPKLEEVRSYLTYYPDIIELVKFACNETRKRFELPTQLSLEVYHDPEIDDEYLTLYVRQEKYDDDIMDIITDIRSIYGNELCDKSGDFHITTDFNYPR